MTLTTAAWLAMAAYSLHILEEYTLDWRNWLGEVICRSSGRTSM